nr:NAD(P)H-hydrate dehydratase [Arcobacter vandammei]
MGGNLKTKTKGDKLVKKVFYEVNSLDKKSYTKYFLSEDILMEHASLSIFNYINKNFKKNSTVLIACGSGNNGADGLALARLLQEKYSVKIFQINKAKSSMAKLQEQRCKALKLDFVSEVYEADIIVDCIFGSGLNRKIDEKTISLIENLNSFSSFKIACDIPSGIDIDGKIESVAFKSNITFTMGALKLALFSDIAKDYVGKIKIVNLGFDSKKYEDDTDIFLLEKSDLVLPKREDKTSQKSTNKGSFGHTNIVCGEKEGAGVLAALAASSFGSGLVTVVSNQKIALPYHIMQSSTISKNCTAIAFGMGLGEFKKEHIDILKLNIPKVLDADIFYEKEILKYLDENVVLTPHPKEFVSLLALSNIANIDIKTLQENRFFYVKEFCKKYPKTTLLLKGANVIISQNEKIYINTLGKARLSKGGSGDVLSGLVASLLAQGYEALNATICGSLAHTLASNRVKKSSYALKPQDIIKMVEKL